MSNIRGGEITIKGGENEERSKVRIVINLK